MLTWVLCVPLLHNSLIYLTLAVTAVTQTQEMRGFLKFHFEMFPHQVAITSSTGLNSL